MKKLLMVLVILIPSCFPGSSLAADLTFGWSPNTESILAGYMIHYGKAPRTYTEHIDVKLPATVDGVVEYTVPSIAAGVKYFAATAYYVDGNVVVNSDYSNEIPVNVPLDAPQGFVNSGASITYNFIPKP